MKISFFFLMISRSFASLITDFEDLALEQKIVIATKQIEFADFPDAFNPSILKIDQGILMSFRYCPDRQRNPWVSFIGIVLLNDVFEPITAPQLLSTRSKNSRTQSQSEDARLFTYRGRIFLIYNDNIEVNNPRYARRDMYVVELLFHNNQFTVSKPLKLVHPGKSHVLWQKNWIPFEWDKKLFIGYTVNPHEILYANLFDGNCCPCYETEGSFGWELGPLRGSTPPLLVDGEYLAFFHSSILTNSSSSWEHDLYHYFIGAYTFSSTPPFKITRMSSQPIVAEEFYTQSFYAKRVVFPGGFVVLEPYIYMAYGKDDSEIWIATIDRQELKKTLKEVSP